MDVYIVFVFSLMIGNFLSTIGFRMLSYEGSVKNLLHCPSCNYRLSFLDTVPVISWVAIENKCESCKEKILYIYIIGELLTAIGFTRIYLKYGFTLEGLIQGILIAGLVVATVTDLREMIVFDRVHIITFILIFALRGIQGWPFLKSFFISSFVMFSLMYFVFILSGDKMGGADAKIYAPIALGVGLTKSIESLFYASGVALVVMLLGSFVFKKKVKETSFPFIPFITVGVIITNCI